MTTMRAMQLDRPGTPLRMVERPLPQPGPHQLRIAVSACGVCRTDLHVVDGDIHGALPIIPGHEIVGQVDAVGPGLTGFAPGDRVGVPWLGRTCGTCPYCRSHRENLCDDPLFTGFTRDGGFATHCLADARYCFPLPDAFDDVHAAPLLCAGLIGYRAYRMAGEARTIGLYGFGAAAHILAQIATWQGRRVFAFTRADDEVGQGLARQYGRDGYRRVTASLRDAGWHVNRKLVERIWRREGLRVPQKQPKRGRLWLNDGSCIRGLSGFPCVGGRLNITPPWP